MNANDIINGFAHKHSCSRFDRQRLIEALILELEELKGLDKEWEDVPEEPNKYYYVDDRGAVFCEKIEEYDHIWHEARRAIGNYFETKEEAEKAVEKLKAWKRLKDKGFMFRKWRTADLGGDKYYFVIQAESDDADKDDLDLLFLGGEE